MAPSKMARVINGGEPRRPATKAPGSLAGGRQAADAGRWAEAFELLGQADRAQPLGSADLDRLAWAAFFTGRAEASVQARQRAFASFMRDRDARRAGLAALNLAMSHFGRGAPAVGAGWLEHAEANLGADTDCEEHGWLVWARTMLAAEGGADTDTALGGAEVVISTGRRLASLDVESLGLLLRGQLLIRVGHIEEGAALLDRVMALAVGGCLGPFATSWVYCGTISACAAVGDYERSWQWTAEVGRCSVQPGLGDFPGDCRLHRAELLRLRGDWSEAETEVARVCEELASWHVGHEARAYCELGELSLRKGDLEAAEAAFRRAQELGMTPQPGLTTLRLWRGEIEPAAVGIVEALAAAQGDPSQKVPLLAVAAEVAVTKGDLDWARSLVDELEALASVYASPPQRARAAAAAGGYALAAGDLDRACRRLAEAVQLWNSVGAPYDAARSRVALATAQLASGNADAHAVELDAALTTFERLGAVLDGRRVAGLLGRPPRTTRVARALMFTDIERSTDLLAAVGDDAWIELLRWHDATLRQLFGRYRGVEIHQKGGGDGFFVAFNSASDALDCAIAAQAQVRSHPEREVSVRIGVHWADVMHADGDFSGRGVHEAARISALADGGELVTSVATLRAANKGYPVKDIRLVELRGLPGEVEIATIDT